MEAARYQLGRIRDHPRTCGSGPGSGGVVQTIVSDRADLSGIRDSSLPFTYAAGDILYGSNRYEAVF